jgi:hypothetical protein
VLQTRSLYSVRSLPAEDCEQLVKLYINEVIDK